MPSGFDFAKTRTCVLVGVGASWGLYPSFCGQYDVESFLNPAVAAMPAEQRGNAQALANRLGERYNWDLERIYDHLSHVPPGFYASCHPGMPCYCDTDWLGQYIVRIIADRLVEAPAMAAIEERAAKWRSLVDNSSHPISFFTTNFDTVLEGAFEQAGIAYSDGWADGDYSAAVAAWPAAEVALVKLHGSANWEHSTHHTSRRVLKAGTAETVTVRPACLEPARRKWLREEPYISGYGFLERSLEVADELVIVGSSCRDESVLSVLYRALGRRDGKHLIVRVVDPCSCPVEERVRLYLHLAGSGYAADLLRWHHLATALLEADLTSEGLRRQPLTQNTDLDTASHWAAIRGEPCMLEPVKEGRFTLRWSAPTYYFESGRMVLLPTLPERFRIDLQMVIKSYGRGWNPGFTLETTAGNEVLCARFIPKEPEGSSEPVWRYENECDADGIHIASGLDVHGRWSVPPLTPVQVAVIGVPDMTAITLSMGGKQIAEIPVPHAPEAQPTRLHLGAYPWYHDDGLASGTHTECEFGPCRVTLLG